MKPSKWTEEYYLVYYDTKGRRYYTPYFRSLKEAEKKSKELKEQELQDITIHTFRY